MKVSGLGLDECTAIVNSVGERFYSSNLQVSRAGSGNRLWDCTFSLGVLDEDGPGASYMYSGGILVRTLSACWHAHYDVLESMFNECSRLGMREDLIVETMRATYRSDNFDRIVGKMSNKRRGEDSVGNVLTNNHMCGCKEENYIG